MSFRLPDPSEYLALISLAGNLDAFVELELPWDSDCLIPTEIILMGLL